MAEMEMEIDHIFQAEIDIGSHLITDFLSISHRRIREDKLEIWCD
jgi:hypothetical protein